MKKFFKKIWGYILKPFKWIARNCKDWRTFVIFAIVYIVLSSEVWVPYIIALCVGLSTPAGIALSGFATACFIFWQLPGTPFLLICLGATAGIKTLWDKHRKKKLK
jgi:hypothetical protein